MAKETNAKPYLTNVRSALLQATIALALMFAFGYPPKDWMGVFVVWYLSFFVVSYATMRLALALTKSCERYTNRVTDGLDAPDPSHPHLVSLIAKVITLSVLILLLMVLVGASLIVTGVMVPLVELTDLGQQFAYVSRALFGIGSMGIVIFLAATFVLLERVKRRKQESGNPPVSRLRLADSAVDALNRLRQPSRVFHLLFSR